MESFVEFPKLGLKFGISDILFQFDLFGQTITIRWYGLIIALGFLLAMIYGLKRAKQFDIDPDRMIDVVLVSALFAFVGARLYFVLFSDQRAEFFANPLSILEVWKGGLGIYGGIIFAFLTALWMCRLRKVNTLAMFDLASLGFLIGQGIGRWGNFFNCEAFGGYTDNLFAMRIKESIVNPSMISAGLLEHEIVENGVKYIQVHPTFLYESCWNLCVLAFMLWYRKRKKFDGEMLWVYFLGYGLGRVWIEGLRTDQLKLPGTGLAVSQLLSAALVGAAVGVLHYKHSKLKKQKNI